MIELPGTAIVGGLVTSTLLTLVVIPVVYSVMDDLPGWIRGLFGWIGRAVGSLVGRSAAGAFAESTLPPAAASAIAPADDAPEEAAVSG